MKITDEMSISLDACVVAEINNDGSRICLYDKLLDDACGQIPLSFCDETEGECFCKNLKAKIDAYFEAKELKVMEEAEFYKSQAKIRKFARDAVTKVAIDANSKQVTKK